MDRHCRASRRSPLHFILLAFRLAMLPRPRLFVKKRGTRRTGTRWAGLVTEGIICAALMIAGTYGLYWLINRVVNAEGAGWWPWFAMIIPLAVFGYGAAGLTGLIWQSIASTE